MVRLTNLVPVVLSPTCVGILSVSVFLGILAFGVMRVRVVITVLWCMMIWRSMIELEFIRSWLLTA